MQRLLLYLNSSTPFCCRLRAARDSWWRLWPTVDRATLEPLTIQIVGLPQTSHVHVHLEQLWLFRTKADARTGVWFPRRSHLAATGSGLWDRGGFAGIHRTMQESRCQRSTGPRPRRALHPSWSGAPLCVVSSALLGGGPGLGGSPSQVPCPRVPPKRQSLCNPPPTLLPQEPGWPEVVKVVAHLCFVYVDSSPNYSFWYKCWTGLKINWWHFGENLNWGFWGNRDVVFPVHWFALLLGTFCLSWLRGGATGLQGTGCCVHGGRRCGQSSMAGTAVGKGTSRPPSGDSGGRSLAREGQPHQMLRSLCALSLLPGNRRKGQSASPAPKGVRFCDWGTGCVAPGRTALELNADEYGFTAL